MSVSKKGNTNAAGNKGKVISEETKQKMREAQTGKTRSEETKAKISAGNKGKTRSEEARANISAGKKGVRHSEEAKASMTKRSAEYKQAYEFRLQGKTYTEIGNILGVTRQYARLLCKRYKHN